MKMFECPKQSMIRSHFQINGIDKIEPMRNMNTLLLKSSTTDHSIRSMVYHCRTTSATFHKMPNINANVAMAAISQRNRLIADIGTASIPHCVCHHQEFGVIGRFLKMIE